VQNFHFLVHHSDNPSHFSWYIAVLFSAAQIILVLSPFMVKVLQGFTGHVHLQSPRPEKLRRNSNLKAVDQTRLQSAVDFSMTDHHHPFVSRKLAACNQRQDTCVSFQCRVMHIASMTLNYYTMILSTLHQSGFPPVRQNKIPWLFQMTLKYFQAFCGDFYNSNWRSIDPVYPVFKNDF